MVTDMTLYTNLNFSLKVFLECWKSLFRDLKGLLPTAHTRSQYNYEMGTPAPILFTRSHVFKF